VEKIIEEWKNYREYKKLYDDKMKKRVEETRREREEE